MKLSVEPASDGACELMGRVLRRHGSIASEYPLVFQRGFSGRLVTLSADGAVRSACAILERELVIGGLRLRAGLIGSVSTDPAWRGRGLASRVLEAAERELADHGCLLSMLWADRPGFYRDRGYREIGSEEDFVLPRELAPRLPATDGVRPMLSTDVSALHQLYLDHRARVERTEREAAAMLACPGMEVLVLERNQEPVAYVCRGRGADLQDVLHEWGGAVDDVLRVVRAHLERSTASNEEDLFLMAPVSAIDTLAHLGRLGAPSVRGILGLAKLLDREGAAALFASLVPDVACTVEGRGGETRIRLRGPRGATSLEPHDLLALLFARRGERTRIDEVGRAVGAGLEEIPLHPFVWGLDSI